MFYILVLEPNQFNNYKNYLLLFLLSCSRSLSLKNQWSLSILKEKIKNKKNGQLCQYIIFILKKNGIAHLRAQFQHLNILLHQPNLFLAFKEPLYSFWPQCSKQSFYRKSLLVDFCFVLEFQLTTLQHLSVLLFKFVYF